MRAVDALAADRKPAHFGSVSEWLKDHEGTGMAEPTFTACTIALGDAGELESSPGGHWHRAGAEPLPDDDDRTDNAIADRLSCALDDLQDVQERRAWVPLRQDAAGLLDRICEAAEALRREPGSSSAA